MNFNLKQWRDESAQEEAEEEAEDQNQPPKPNSYDHHPCALPLFSSEPNTNMSEPYSKSHYHPNTPSADKFSSMGSYFSCSQWQELELQALIFRHMTAGASVPLELLHLVKKSLINTPSSPYYTYYQPPLLQSGYWGRSGMDPEPGRCRRTDGKKWRCSRDVVAGQKYCERHMHRGRNRSRKPVETPTSVPYGGETPKTHYSVAKQAPAAGTNSFTLTTTTPRSSDLLHLNQRRACDSIIETKKGGPFEPQDDGQSSGRTLRHFFDDWPKPIQESGSAASDTNLSIWMPGNPPSDFGLKLGTGGVGDRPSSDLANNSNNSNKAHSSWSMAWENNNNPGAPMGGPLAEALRSSASNSPSPTSVLYRLARGSVSETSFVTL